MEADLLCDISSDEDDRIPSRTSNISVQSSVTASRLTQSIVHEDGAVDLSPLSSPEPAHFAIAPSPSSPPSFSASCRQSPLLEAISTDDDDVPIERTQLSSLAAAAASSVANDAKCAEKKILQETDSDDANNTATKTNSSRWLDEQTKWQRITASDFDDFCELSDTDDELEQTAQAVAETNFWSQSIIPTKFYVRNNTGGQLGTNALRELQEYFEARILRKVRDARNAQPRSDPPPVPKFHTCSTCTKIDDGNSASSADDEGLVSSGSESDASTTGDSSCSSSLSSSGASEIRECEALFEGRRTRRPTRKKCKGNTSVKSSADHSHRPTKQALMAQAEIERKQNHPAGLHSELCFNESGQLNDGVFCRCSWSSKQTGIRHNKFAGESAIPRCDFNQSNMESLHHYVLRVTPNPNEFTRRATCIDVDGLTYTFDGFSVFFHRPLPDAFPQAPMNGWSTDFSACFMRENSPESYTIKDLELFYEYLFDDVMELYDMDRMPNSADAANSCPYFHCMPRFVRVLRDGGKEILPMSTVLKHFADLFESFVNDTTALDFSRDHNRLLDVARARKGALFLNPEKKPMCIRVDLIDSHSLQTAVSNDKYPIFTHFGTRPSAYSYNGRPEYQRALKHFIKLRHLLSSKPRLCAEDRQKLRHSENKLKHLRSDCKLKRDIQVQVSSRGFFETGLFPDVVQHALMLVSMCAHVRFHWSLHVFEHERLKYVFKNKVLLELALTHPSYRSNYGTNPDHAKNTNNNCGLIQTRIRGTQSAATLSADIKPGRKRGIAALIEIMSKQGSTAKTDKTASSVNHNERLEFLGDAIVEFIATVHLFFMFPDLEEGGLATYRSALVQNKHLASLAKKLGLHEFMLYAHGPDLCHEAELRHAMANAFEAMMAAIYLDSNINECDREHPFGDRHLIDMVPFLKMLSEFEENIGIRFKHIRLLAKAFTRRNVGFNYLTLGHNQRLEFLGDTVLQLITTDYLYRHFPNHQEGHLSLLRTCLVSNKTQSVICDDLSIPKYLIIPKALERSGKISTTLRVKDKADLVESFIGALYVDRGLQYCKVFCRVCFFPRLKYFILTQRWNDPKSQLQQCCLTLRQPCAGEPDIPEYKTIGAEGPTNTRAYRVAVYFRNKRLADGVGGSIQLAQMQAAENALITKADMFPSFDFSKTYLSATLSPDSKTPAVRNSTKKRRNDPGTERSFGAKRRRLDLNERQYSNENAGGSMVRGFFATSNTRQYSPGLASLPANGPRYQQHRCRGRSYGTPAMRENFQQRRNPNDNNTEPPVRFF